MSHFLGPVVSDGRTIDQNHGLDLMPPPGPLGGPRFLILHFTNANLTGNSKLTVELGYDTDVFDKNAGADFWSRPVDTTTLPVKIRVTGNGTVKLLEYGSGEPGIPPGQRPAGEVGQSNPDPFLQTNPYQEPTYETRLECNTGFDWQNAACPLPGLSAAVQDKVRTAVGIIIHIEPNEFTVNGSPVPSVSSCSGTLIGADLFLTARHCLNDPQRRDINSASVTFDYATACDGTRPPGLATRFYKVIGELASGMAPNGLENVPAATDWVIVRLDTAPGNLPAPLTIRDAALMSGETIFTMHHPYGAVKKTQIGVSGISGADVVKGFDYAGGSSGSALFDANGQIVGGPLNSGSGCTVGYAPAAPIKSALANPPTPPAPLDVMVVFDRSGSMASPAPPMGRTKLQEAQDAAALFIQLIREGANDRLGLVSFSTTATIDVAPDLVATVKPTLVGPSPFNTGAVGALAAGGSTTIGGGLDVALIALGFNSTNRPAMLLLTDGLQNTLPMVESVEPLLQNTLLSVIGLGSDSDIDAPFLSRLARDHGGQFTRAIDGVTLKKFFGQAFGNIFESGALTDPEQLLAASQSQSSPHTFSVCGEERITIILGWDQPDKPLQAHITLPSGAALNERRVKPVRGRTWAFWRIPLPQQGERDGQWQFVVDRVRSGEIQNQFTDVRYFYLVIAAGGPKLSYLGGKRRVYTGDPIDALVGLHYGDRTTPGGDVRLTVTAPTVALGQLVMNTGLRPPISSSPDVVDAFHATLQNIAQQSGGVLPVAPATLQFPLFDDGRHNDGAMEPDGIFNNVITDLTKVEGTYDFAAVATYGDQCQTTRQVFWSVHVEPGIDPSRSTVTIEGAQDGPNGESGVLVIVPRDVYGNPLGPGRAGGFTVSATPGVNITGPVTDRGDGSYSFPAQWPSGTEPGIVITQPDRDPVVLTPSGTYPPQSGKNDCRCTKTAGQLLDCLGLKNQDVECVQVKKVTVEIDVSGKDCEKPRKKCCCD